MNCGRFRSAIHARFPTRARGAPLLLDAPARSKRKRSPTSSIAVSGCRCCCKPGAEATQKRAVGRYLPGELCCAGRDRGAILAWCGVYADPRQRLCFASSPLLHVDPRHPPRVALGRHAYRRLRDVVSSMSSVRTASRASSSVHLSRRRAPWSTPFFTNPAGRCRAAAAAGLIAKSRGRTNGRPPANQTARWLGAVDRPGPARRELPHHRTRSIRIGYRAERLARRRLDYPLRPRETRRVCLGSSLRS